MIQKYKENSFIITYQENAEDFNFIVDKKISQDISLFGNSLNFEVNANKDEKRNREEKVFVGEYKLYSFSIQEEDLSFSKYYLDKFHYIANSNLSDEKKAQELENIFKEKMRKNNNKKGELIKELCVLRNDLRDNRKKEGKK